MNLAALKTHIANRTGNDAIDSVLNEFIKQVEYDFCTRYPFSWRLSLPVSVTTIANQSYINPSAYFTDFAEPWYGVELSTPKKLIYLPNWDVHRLQPDVLKSSGQTQGVPSHYSIDWTNQRLWFYPTPNSAVDCKFVYLKQPPEWINSSAHSSLFIPQQHHQVLAAGVESLVWQMDEDLQSAQAANSRYETGISNAIEREQQLPDYQPLMTPASEFIDYSDPFLEI